MDARLARLVECHVPQLLDMVGIGPDTAVALLSDRQADAALHRIVFTRRRVDPRTQDYYERRIKEDKIRREIVRCLKRYAARQVFHLVEQLQPDPRSRGSRDR
ncbi:hypothetical protein ACIP2Y_43275 [Streptomyces sviceus]|uniref:hypothetical protein n=1 Tax=Streptomyces sviceus TaxID=285530 RepID=UPI0038027A3A